MDNTRLILFIALSLVILMLWSAWQQDYGPHSKHATPTVASAPHTSSVAPTTATGQANAPARDLPPTGGAAPAAQPTPVAAPSGTGLLPSTGRIHVRTDVLDVTIDTTGGDLRQADLLKYPASAGKPHTAFPLLNDNLPNIFVAQSGLVTSDGPQPTHHVVYKAARTDYALAAGQDEIKVPLYWRAPNGVTVTKIYTFRRGSYVIGLQQQVHNGTAKPWTGRAYGQLQRTKISLPGATRFVHTYMGGVIYSPQDKYQKVSFEDMTKSTLARNIKAGWAAMTEHYFLGAIIPPANQDDHYYTRVLSHGRYVIGLIAPPVTIAPGAEHTFAERLFVGPKLQDTLASVAPGLQLTVDYGYLTVLAEPIFWALSKLHGLLGNWGWAIIVLTIFIKAVFYKLSETSYRSMAQMRKLGPRMKSLKERYGDDKQRLNQAMMELYKTEKINPLGGCLPIVVQIPVFIALYWVLLDSVELRQAPWVLWIHDLSAPDPIYVLPAIMGLTMLAQNRLNPTPVDPLQKRMMMMMPIAFTVFFAFFPAGLVLYWVTNNALSIAQQYMITRRMESGTQKT